MWLGKFKIISIFFVMMLGFLAPSFAQENLEDLTTSSKLSKILENQQRLQSRMSRLSDRLKNNDFESQINQINKTQNTILQNQEKILKELDRLRIWVRRN